VRLDALTTSMRNVGLTLGLLLSALGCEGHIVGLSVPRAVPNGVDPADPDAVMLDACAQAPVTAAAAGLKRLTATQLINTERDLFSSPTLEFAVHAGHEPVVTLLEVDKLNAAVHALIATGKHLAFSPCDVKGSGSEACAQGFIRALGQKAFRRPVSADEVTWLTDTWRKARAVSLVPAITFEESLGVVAEVMLQSLPHLYLRPVGVVDGTLPAGLRTLDGYERASQLSYLLLDSMPTPALFAAAASGELDTADGVRTHARALLDGPSGRKVVRDFASHYLGLDATELHPSLEDNPKSATRFPFDTPELRAAMRTESAALFEASFSESGDTFASLMTSNRAFVNGPLASLYGVTGVTGNTFRWVDLDATQRAGLFTRAAFLSITASQEYQSPIHRGVFVLRDTLCQVVAPPPPDVDNTPLKPVTGALSIRQLTDGRTQGAECIGCHAQFNPIGYTLENYDAFGRWQVADTGKLPDGTPFSTPVDSTATIVVSDLQGTVSGGRELSEKLAHSAMARDCMATQWFHRIIGRAPVAEDACTVARLRADFRKTGDLKTLVLDTVTSPSALLLEESP
jgi:hypothetical protein